MSDAMSRRLRHLETIWPKPRCSTCLGRPHRVVMIDMESDTVVSENMPGTGCPECGASVYREYRIEADRSNTHQGESA